MELAFKDRFISLWEKYFNGAELPITFYHTDQEGDGELVQPPLKGHQCFIGVLTKVRKGQYYVLGRILSAAVVGKGIWDILRS